MKTIKVWGLVFLVLAAIYLGIRLDYAIYKAAHPGAPGWTYLIYGGRR